MSIDDLKAARTHRSERSGSPCGASGLGFEATVGAASDAAESALRAARGVVVEDSLKTTVVRDEARMAQRTDAISQGIDSLALEVKGLLGRMRQLASKSARIETSSEDRTVIQDEFSMLQVQLDRLVRSVGIVPDSHGMQPSAGCSSLQMSDDVVQRMTAQALGVDEQTASVGTADDAEWALVRIDAAERSVSDFRDELGTVEERIDAALERLAEFVETISPVAARKGRATDVFEAAERIRMQIMQEAGVRIVGHSHSLPKSVSSLLQ